MSSDDENFEENQVNRVAQEPFKKPNSGKFKKLNKLLSFGLATLIGVIPGFKIKAHAASTVSNKSDKTNIGKKKTKQIKSIKNKTIFKKSSIKKRKIGKKEIGLGVFFAICVIKLCSLLGSSKDNDDKSSENKICSASNVSKNENNDTLPENLSEDNKSTVFESENNDNKPLTERDNLFLMLVKEFCRSKSEVKNSIRHFKTMTKNQKQTLKELIKKLNSIEEEQNFKELKNKLKIISKFNGSKSQKWNRIFDFCNNPKNNSAILSIQSEYFKTLENSGYSELISQFETIVKAHNLPILKSYYSAWKNYVDTGRHYEAGNELIKTGKEDPEKPVVLMPMVTEKNVSEEFLRSQIELLKSKYWNFFEIESWRFLEVIVGYIQMFARSRNIYLDNKINEISGFYYYIFHDTCLLDNNYNVLDSNKNEIRVFLDSIKENLKSSTEQQISVSVLSEFVEVLEANYEKVKNKIDEQKQLEIIKKTKNKRMDGEIFKVISVPIKNSAWPSLRNYVADSTFFNEHLRNGTSLRSDMLERLKLIQNNLSKSNLPSQMRLWRYITFKATKEMFQVENCSSNEELVHRLNEKKGSKFLDKGFISTTIEKGLEEDLRFGNPNSQSVEINGIKSAEVELEIVAPKGTQGSYLPNYFGLSSNQKEFLLAPGQTFEIIDARTGQDGYHAQIIVKVKIVPMVVPNESEIIN